jgi:hypothetical protein
MWNESLALWKLAPAGLTASGAREASAGQVGAFYSNVDKTITIVDSGYPLDSRQAVALLVHEYTHALQDAAFDLTVLERSFADLDRSMAGSAVIEGDASVVEDLANVGLFGDQPSDIGWGKVFDRWRVAARRRAFESAIPVTLAWVHFNYPFGTPFVHAARSSGGGWASVDSLFQAPPSGAREVLAGYGAAEPTGGPWAEDLGADTVAVLPAPLAYFDFDRMGAWIFELFVNRAIPETKRPVVHLRGDALSIFEDGVTGGIAAVWRLRFASFEEATSLRDAFQQFATPDLGNWIAVRLLEGDLVLIAGNGQAAIPAAGEPLIFQSPPPKTTAATSGAAGWLHASGVRTCTSRPSEVEPAP